MLQQLKDNRFGSPGCLGEEYIDDNGILCSDKCHEEWSAILDEMIFLFREADEETCLCKNPFEEEHNRISGEFESRYGLFGEKLEQKKKRIPNIRECILLLNYLSIKKNDILVKNGCLINTEMIVKIKHFNYFHIGFLLYGIK